MKEYSGLNNLRSVSASKVYCPKCGNYLEVVDNGWFGGELLFCPKEKLVFAIQLKDMTKKAGKEFIEQCEFRNELENIRLMINKTNIKEVKNLLNPPVNKLNN